MSNQEPMTDEELEQAEKEIHELFAEVRQDIERSVGMDE